MSNIFQPLVSGGSSGGGGGSKNYLAVVTTSNGANTGNGDFELNATTGWSKGTVTLTSALPTGVPTFGSGSNANLSIAIITASQLSGLCSLSYASSSATTAGDFVASDAFNIDTEDQAKVLTFKFYYNAHTNPGNANWSGTSSNSFGVAIYDVTNSAWIIPAGVWSMTQSTGTGYATGTFQSTSNSTAYRIVVYNANATSGAVTLYFDDFNVGPQTAPMGPVMTDGTSFTPTVNGLVSLTSPNASWWRNGDSLRMRGFAVGTSATATNLGICFPYPWMSVDNTKVGISTYQICGEFTNTNAGTGLKPICIGGATGVNFTYQGTSLLAQLANSQFTVNSNFTFDVQVPITGWSSNVQMSNDTDTRVVAAFYNTASTQSLTANVTNVIYGTQLIDTHAAMNAATGVYTVPVSGIYNVTAAMNIAALSNADLYKNGSTSWRIVYTPTIGQPACGSALVSCVAGDTLSIRSSVTTSLSSQAAGNYFSINRLSGPAVVAATESVNARYFASATSISGSLATVSWTTKDYDSHNAMSAGTYTIPVSGKYQVNSALALAGTFGLNSTSNIQIQKNGTVVGETLNDAGGIITNSNISVSDIISCVAGDTIRIQVLTSATGPSIVSSNSKNYFSIARVGN